MSYFEINGIDLSQYINALNITKTHNYNAQTNAAGDSVVDYINSKRQFEVGIIALDAEAMKTIQSAIDSLGLTISFLNPKTNSLEENVNCILPSWGVEYYTIQADKTLFNAFTLTFTEL